MIALVQGELEEEDDEIECQVQLKPDEMVSDVKVLLRAHRSWENLIYG